MSARRTSSEVLVLLRPEVDVSQITCDAARWRGSSRKNFEDMMTKLLGVAKSAIEQKANGPDLALEDLGEHIPTPRFCSLLDLGACVRVEFRWGRVTRGPERAHEAFLGQHRCGLRVELIRIGTSLLDQILTDFLAQQAASRNWRGKQKGNEICSEVTSRK